MAHYSGSQSVVEFQTGASAQDISATDRTIDLDETIEDSAWLDTTHKADAVGTGLDGIPGQSETDVSISVVDETGVAGVLLKQYDIGTKGTLFIYPEGKTSGKPKITIPESRLNKRGTKYPYDNVVEVTGTFKAKSSATRGTAT
jgi:hypothetical protein